ncbi:PAS domain-containing protein [Senegalimassilia sp.]
MQSLLEANYAVGVIEGLLDDNLTVTYASRLFYKHLGYGTDDVKRFNGHSFLDIVHPDDLEEFKCKLFSSLTDLRHDFHFDATYRGHVRGNGSVRFRSIGNANRRSDGSVSHAVGVFFNVDEGQRQKEIARVLDSYWG